MGERAKGPFFDDIDPRWAPIIHEAFVRIARDEPPWSVADWLTEQGLSKCNNAPHAEWRDYNVAALIRRPDYRGVQTHRDTVSEKEHSTGRRRPKKNEDEDTILTREMPHLRIVPDALWYQANDALDRRDKGKDKREQRRGIPQVKIPRDSRNPLSQMFYCAVCKQKMHQQGRNVGGYRCSKMRDRHDPCWNKASALRDLSNKNISRAIVEKLLATKDHLDVLVDYSERIVKHDGSIDRQLKEALAEQERLSLACERLVDAIEGSRKDSGDTPETLRERLLKRAEEKAKAGARVEQLQHARLHAEQAKVTRKQSEAAIDQAAERLLSFDRESGVLLRRLITRMEAVPYQQFLSNNVVLRARFELNMARLLPMQLASLLNGEVVNTEAVQVVRIPMCVDLFDPSMGPKYGLEAHALKLQGLILEQIGRELNISKRSAHIAAQYGKAMIEAAITDRYIELTAPPAKASRWR